MQKVCREIFISIFELAEQNFLREFEILRGRIGRIGWNSALIAGRFADVDGQRMEKTRIAARCHWGPRGPAQLALLPTRRRPVPFREQGGTPSPPRKAKYLVCRHLADGISAKYFKTRYLRVNISFHRGYGKPSLMVLE
jgi:hypothetical protein